MKWKRRDKCIALSNFSIYYTWKNIKQSHKNNKFKISAPTWNEEFELLDRSYSVSNIQDYFEYIIKNHETVTDNPSIRMYVNKIENRITFETMKLLGSTKSRITKDINGENLSHLEMTEVVLVVLLL